MGLFSNDDYREYVPQPKEELSNLRSRLTSGDEDYDPSERIEMAVLKLLDETNRIRRMMTFFYVMGILSLAAGIVYAILLIF